MFPREVPYVETSPNRLLYRPRADSSVSDLMVSLDTFEGLFRLAHGSEEGFSGVPRGSQLRNYRETLRSVPVEDMVIVELENPRERVVVERGERFRLE